MTRDRLAEFRQRAGISTPIGGDGDTPKTESLQIISPQNRHISIHIHHQPHHDDLNQFLNEVTNLKSLIADLKTDVENVKGLHSKILSTPIPDDKKKTELDDQMQTIKIHSQIIRAKLKDMERSIRKGGGANSNETDTLTRIKQTQHNSLFWEFMEVLNDYQFAEEEYSRRCKTRIKRQLEITGSFSQFSDEDVDKMLDDGDWSVLTRGISLETEQARQVLHDCEARHDDILKLEKSLKELHGLFLEVALLVENQGEVVDRIENHVDKAQEYVVRANEHLVDAEELQRKANKKKFIIITILVLIVTVVGLVALFYIFI